MAMFYWTIGCYCYIRSALLEFHINSTLTNKTYCKSVLLLQLNWAASSPAQHSIHLVHTYFPETGRIVNVRQPHETHYITETSECKPRDLTHLKSNYYTHAPYHPTSALLPTGLDMSANNFMSRISTIQRYIIQLCSFSCTSLFSTLSNIHSSSRSQ